MPTFLSDPPTVLYAILLLGVFITGARWINRQDRKSLIALGIALALTSAVFLIDRFFESPREEAKRDVEAMAAAANARDVKAFLSHVADTFEYEGDSANPVSVSREQLRKAGLWSILDQWKVRVATWGFDRNDMTEIDDNTVEIGFFGKGESANGSAPMYFRARFARQSDGQMKLTRLSSYDPVKQTNERKGIPYFP
jgi:hypothetical protein